MYAIFCFQKTYEILLIEHRTIYFITVIKNPVCQNARLPNTFYLTNQAKHFRLANIFGSILRLDLPEDKLIVVGERDYLPTCSLVRLINRENTKPNNPGWPEPTSQI